MGENCYTGNILKTVRKRVWQGHVAEGFWRSDARNYCQADCAYCRRYVFYWHIRNGVRTYAFSRKSQLRDYWNIMLVRSWQNLKVARLRHIFTWRCCVVLVLRRVWFIFVQCGSEESLCECFVTSVSACYFAVRVDLCLAVFDGLSELYTFNVCVI